MLRIAAVVAACLAPGCKSDPPHAPPADAARAPAPIKPRTPVAPRAAESEIRELPKGALVARVIEARTEGDRTLVTLATGSDAGVSVQMRAWLVRDDGTPLKNGALTLVRVNKQEVIAAVRGTLDDVRTSRRAVLTP